MRRHSAALLIIACALGFAAPRAAAQDAYHWPHRTFSIPVNVERINQSENKPTHLQLFSSLNRAAWKEGVKLPVNGLDDIGNGRKGFKYTADRDGEYEFSVMYHYAGGDTSPRRTDDLAPMLAVVIDTTPPTVRIAATGNGVKWDAQDDNLDLRNVKLEAKLPSWTQWKRVEDREFKTNDSYAWKLAPGQSLEVRVTAKDKAGNEGSSAIVRVPGNEAIGASFPKLPAGGGSDWPPVANLPRDPIGVLNSNLPKPRIEYVSTPEFTVDYTIQKAGRSGVKAVSLFVQHESGAWKFDKKFEINPPADTGKTLSLKYTADKAGLYGFFVAPESGAGVKADPPRKDDTPMLYVVFDQEAPFVKITGVRVIPGGVRGPLVEIAWETNDQNLMADPITLEYSVDKDAPAWKEVKYRLPPGQERADGVGQKRYVGTYTWEVPDETLWKFHVRIRSVDKAGNTGKDQWKDEVIVDLEKPSAGITGVRGSGSGSGSPSIPSNPSTTPLPKLPGGKLPEEKPAEGPKLPDIP
ncbi:MAG: hypothetical protein U0791_27405 [Gemmataceae bacterium]